MEENKYSAQLERIAQKMAQDEARKQLKEALDKAKKKTAERKTEDKKKYTVGGLVKLAELLDQDKGTLLGAFLEIRDTLKEPKEHSKKIAQWKSHGDALLAKREKAKKAT